MFEIVWKVLSGGLVKVLSKVWDALKAILSTLVTVAKDHPKETMIVVLLIVTNVLSSLWWYHNGIADQLKKDQALLDEKTALIDKFEADVKARDTKVKQVEADSKIAADKAQAEISKRDKKYAQAKTEFERQLAEEIAKRGHGPGSTTVVSPETGNKVVVTLEKDEVICSRFHDSFLDSINSMVGTTNESVSVTGAELGVRTETAPIPLSTIPPPKEVEKPKMRTSAPNAQGYQKVVFRMSKPPVSTVENAPSKDMGTNALPLPSLTQSSTPVVDVAKALSNFQAFMVQETRPLNPLRQLRDVVEVSPSRQETNFEPSAQEIQGH